MPFHRGGLLRALGRLGVTGSGLLLHSDDGRDAYFRESPLIARWRDRRACEIAQRLCKGFRAGPAIRSSSRRSSLCAPAVRNAEGPRTGFLDNLETALVARGCRRDCRGDRHLIVCGRAFLLVDRGDLRHSPRVLRRRRGSGRSLREGGNPRRRAARHRPERSLGTLCCGARLRDTGRAHRARRGPSADRGPLRLDAIAAAISGARALGRERRVLGLCSARSHGKPQHGMS